MIDLIKKFGNNRGLLNDIKKQNKHNTKHPIYKVGDIISFYGGLNSDIHFISRITGFDDNGDIYVLWDCYWFPIREKDVNRRIKLIKNY